MPQTKTWNKEYKKPLLLSLQSSPQNDVKDFLKFVRKIEKIELKGLSILDLGSGTGRNSNYLAELGSKVVGLEISKVAMELARKRAVEMGVTVDYRIYNIGTKYTFDDSSFDLVLDVLSSNSLNEMEREIYLTESHRILKPQGHFFVKALCKDGDKNAKNLLKISPGSEHDTYVNKDMGLVERVFSEKDFRSLYSRYFTILKLVKKTNYAKFRGQNYKRNYWLAYMKKA